MVHEKYPKTTKKCEICGDKTEVDNRYLENRKQVTCSPTCRGHFYRNIEDTKKIMTAIKTHKTDNLKFTMKRVLDLGFKIIVTK